MGTPSNKYIENWHYLEQGMTSNEVLEVIGEPGDKIVSENPREERWHYGTFELGENFLAPSKKAYVIWFDKNEEVIKFRVPINSEPKR